jgi:hypothetical protein
MKTPAAQTFWPARPAKLLAGRERHGVARRCESKPGHMENAGDARRIAVWRGKKRVLKLRLRSARERADTFRCDGARKTAKGKGKAADHSKGLPRGLVALRGSFNP